MARNGNNKPGSSRSTGFQFIYIKWSDSQLDALRKWYSSEDRAFTELLYLIVSSGWKVSVSEHTQTGRILATLTDKWDRPGCDNCCFCIEHSTVDGAVKGAFYAASELLHKGSSATKGDADSDLW